MQVTILGSGTSIPLSYKASPSTMLKIEDNIIILDMGPGTLRQLSRVGIESTRINHILISHFHPDHTADLIHFLFVTRNPSVFAGRKPFLISGATGLKALIRNLQHAYFHWLDIPEDKMEVEELEVEGPIKKEHDTYSVISRPVKHAESSLAYRIEDEKGKSVVYSGDTEFCEEIISLAENTDLLILECAVPEDSGLDGHLTPSEAGRIASAAKAKKLLLVHFYPEILTADISGECRKYYDGELILGKDLLQIEP
ncbi:MBL fold metallo-hydrolase [Thermodesulfobacteriota bacterium]